MSIRDDVLEIFEKSGGDVSGEEISHRLGVSRNAVWKAVKALRGEGFIISAAPNRGYKLERRGDYLSQAGIVRHLDDGDIFTVEVLKTVTSTNTILRKRAAKGLPEGYLLAAEEQTAGRGRFGRSFYSPAGSGVYFSLLLRPRLGAGEATLITSAAAVAVSRAIESVTGVKTDIKWVNDVFYKDGKKVCGILTEASFDMESGLIDTAVLGIGINVTSPEGGYPDSLCDVAGYLKNAAGDGVRAKLIAAVVNEFWPFYKNLAAKEFLSEYRARSNVIGRDITVLSAQGERQAYAVGIDDNCGLVVRYENGDMQTLTSGEVSIKRKDD